MLQHNKDEVFVHIDNLKQYIAKELNVNIKKISLTTYQKSIIANESNNYQHKAFEKLTVLFKDKNLQSEHDFNEIELKNLIAKNLHVVPESLNLQYFCNIKPGGNGTYELNYIGITNNNPEVKLNLDTTFNKIEQMRKKYLSTANNNNQNMSI